MGVSEQVTSAQEAEKSSLLKAVSRERQTQEAGKDLAGAVTICELRRLSVVPSRVYKWLINPFTNPNPVYSHANYWTIRKKNINQI
jgi:hypothetical protein